MFDSGAWSDFDDKMLKLMTLLMNSNNIFLQILRYIRENRDFGKGMIYETRPGACLKINRKIQGIGIMEKTAQFHAESVDSLVERFRRNGLETINLGLLCFRFVPALNGMNLISVLTKISKMIQTKKVPQVEDSHITNWYFNFYAGFIQYLVNRNIKFEVYYSKKGKSWRERLDLALLCRQLGNYQRTYEKKLRSA